MMSVALAKRVLLGSLVFGGLVLLFVTITSDKAPYTPTSTVAAQRATERYSARLDRVEVVFEQYDYTHYRLTTNSLVREGELNTERGFKDDPDATVYVLNWQKPVGEQIRYVRLTDEPTKLYTLDSTGEIIAGSALTLTTP